MYPGAVAATTVAGGTLAGGTLAATGLAVTGYVWAALIVLVLGLVLTILGVLRDRAIARRSLAR